MFECYEACSVSYTPRDNFYCDGGVQLFLECLSAMKPAVLAIPLETTSIVMEGFSSFLSV